MRAASQESWEAYRGRMLAETSRFIEWGLAHPDQVLWIPAKPARQQGFPRAVGEWFWTTALGDGATGRLRQWRSRLLRRPRLFPSQT